jgi:hypothetical protein
VNAIKQLRKRLEADPNSESARTLARLAAALAEEKEFPLGDLYRLDYESFDLALELLKDWRLDRYYAARIRLFDVVLNDVLPEEIQVPS